MKRALVLSGGGSRGAYEIGAWQALEEIGVRFDAVYGTSIGALNAGLVAQGDPDMAAKLWASISLKQVIRTDEEDFAIDKMISRKRDVIPFLLENAKHLNADIGPLENLLAQYLSEGRVRASGMELGVMNVRAPQMQPVPVRLKDIPDGQLADWLIASASCFPIFPARKIDGEREIVAVDIHPQPCHPEYARMPFLKMIHPLHNLGGFLDFNPKLLKRSRLMGYYDAKKAYGYLDGIRYTFVHQSELKIAAEAREYMRRVAAFDAEAITRRAFSSSQEMDAPLISALEAETPLKKLSWKEVWLRGMELCAEQMGFREDAIYEPELLMERILKFAAMGEKVTRMTRMRILEVSRMGSRELVSYFYRSLQTHGSFPADCVETLAVFPKETAAAMFLHTAG